jgi:response regulator RpfG family c-di-GMP phosphodiesterase
MDDLARITEPAASLRAEASHKVLVVDDEESVLRALREALRHEGYEIFAHLDPRAALDTLASEPVAVVIADQRMPHLSGLELLERVRQQQPDASRILITAVLSLDTVIDAINRGEIYRFIVKPWLREELLATVRNAVQRFDLLRSNRALQEETRSANARLLHLNASLEQQVRQAEEQNHQLAGLNRSLSQNVDGMLKLCVRSLEAFSPTLGTQARRTFQICSALSAVVDLSDQDRRLLETAAWLHDLGLVGAPRRLIRLWQDAPAHLSDAEWAVIRRHPVIGQELVEPVEQFSGVGDIIRAHHERYDGGGYPDRLAGEAIPWGARLLAVAVAFAASAGSGAAALDSVRADSGRLYDPRAVRALLSVAPRLVLTRLEKVVELSQVEPGMVLAREVYSSNGRVLVPEGSALSLREIHQLQDSERSQPLTLTVYC